MSNREYVPPAEPLPSTMIEPLVRFLDGQSLIRAAYKVGMRYRSFADGAVRTDHALWFDVGGRRRGRAARRALSQGLSVELRPILRRPGLGWNCVTRRTLTEASSALRLLWRAPDSRPDRLDPLAFELRWLPLSPPSEFAAGASAILERCPGMRRAYLMEEVLFKDGVRVSSRPRIHFESYDRRWPREIADELMALGRREWRTFGVGRERALPLTPEHATEIFRREPAKA